MANPTLDGSSKTEMELFGWNNTSWREVKIDASTRSLQTIGYEHHEIHSGSHYYVCGFETLALNAFTEFYFTTPITSKEVHMTFEFSGTQQTEMVVHNQCSFDYYRWGSTKDPHPAPTKCDKSSTI